MYIGIYRLTYGWMDGWVHGWMDGWMDLGIGGFRLPPNLIAVFIVGVIFDIWMVGWI